MLGQINFKCKLRQALMDWKHPSYYKALAKQRRDFEASEREQAIQESVPHPDIKEANKQERERASKRRLTSKKRRLTSD